MISVIVYGRNDSHGYNLPKRAAISFNCIADVLNHPDDEIIFVDCNTPDDLPTFPESIADTLTPRAKELLRILRLRPSQYEKGRNGTRFKVLEPLCRNVGIRRSNANNRWILNTNTDMVFAPLAGRSLSEVCAKLADGFYELPRFEMPEILWESTDRLNPRAIIRDFQSWGRRLHINERVDNMPEVVFDGPGDFQLSLRKQLFAIHGMNEQMVLGWHVDSNLCKRMFLLNGKNCSLLDQVYAFHCDHTRLNSVYHSATESTANDWHKYFSEVNTPYLPEQSKTWGLPDEFIEEISLNNTSAVRYLKALTDVLPGLDKPMLEAALIADSWNSGLYYDNHHILPYLADHLSVIPGQAKVGYVGANFELLKLLARFRRDFGHSGSLLVENSVFTAGGTDGLRELPANCRFASLDELRSQASVICVDLWMGNFPAAKNRSGFMEPRPSPEAARFGARLMQTTQELARHERTVLETSPAATRKFLFLGSQNTWFEDAASQMFNIVLTPFSSYVRHGFIRKDAFDMPFRPVNGESLLVEPTLVARIGLVAGRSGEFVSEIDLLLALQITDRLAAAPEECSPEVYARYGISDPVRDAVMEMRETTDRINGLQSNADNLATLRRKWVSGKSTFTKACSRQPGIRKSEANAPIRVAVDAQTFYDVDSMSRGIGHFALHHLQALGSSRPDWRFVLTSPHKNAPAQAASLLRAGNFSYQSLEHCSPEDFDIYHIPDPMTLAGDTLSPMTFLEGVPCTATFHDLIPLRVYLNAYKPAERVAYIQRLGDLKQRGVTLLANSEYTKTDALRAGLAKSDSIHAIGAGLNRKLGTHVDPAFTRQLLKRLKIDRPFFLHVGAVDHHKNFDSVIKAFGAAYQQVNTQLVVVGRKTGMLEKIAEEVGRLKLDNVVFTDFISREELDALYSSAIALIFLSFYEGFGFPALEAMAAGCPVICSNTTSLPEVTGDAALSLAPNDIQGAARAMVNLARDKAERERRRAKGLEQAARFTWTAVAERTVRVWEQLLKGRPAAAPSARPERESLPPVAWLAPWQNASGFCSEAHAFALGLQDKCDLELADTAVDKSAEFVRGLPPRQRDLLARHLGRSVNPAGKVVVMHGPGYVLSPIDRALASVGRTMFETDRLPPDWVERCNLMTEVWVPSRFNVETFAASGVDRTKLFVVPEAVDADHFDPAKHPPLELPNRAGFNFLAVFEWIARKGWDILLKAYLQEFSASDDVCLYLRTNSANGTSRVELESRVRSLAVSLNLGGKALPKIELLLQTLSSNELPGLYRSVDCLVAPSRGEGWGRPQHEAMMMGLPVIATNWSGITEFARPGTFYPLDFELVTIDEVDEGFGHYRGHRWANPSVEHLRRQMRRVWQNPDEARAVGTAAREHVRTHFGIESVVGVVLERLAAINSITQPANAASPSPADKLEINWHGSFLDYGSLSNINRVLTDTLVFQNDASIRRIQTAPVNGKLAKPLQSYRGKLAGSPNAGAALTVRHAWPPDWSRPTQGKLAIIQPWEFGSLPQDWVRASADVDAFWVPSNYVRQVYLDSGVPAEKVHVLPNGIDPKVFLPEAKRLPLATRKKFKFLYVGGTIHRKGPDVLLNAYCNTFSAQDDVCLVIKDFGGGSVYSGQTIEQQIRAIQKQPGAPEILYLNKDLPARDLPGLYTACDCLVHPYRGEGFGLPVLEAMACGLPVIVTAGGATDDFVSDEAGYRIPAVRKHFGREISGMPLVGEGWLLEPDIAVLKNLLRHVIGQSNEARAKGRAGSRLARESWTWNHSANRLVELARQCAAGNSPAVAKQNAVPTKSAVPIAINLPAVAKLGHLGAARELFKQDKLGPAWNATRKAIEQRPFHPAACLLLAEIAAQCGDGAAMKACVDRALSLAPNWRAARDFARSHKPRANKSGFALAPLPAVGEPRLSVCLITKNEEQFLDQCLRSIKDVAHQIVVMDTGSTDRTIDIAKQHGAEIYSFEWCDDFSAARNAVLEKATGDWVLVLDADEELAPDSKAALQKAMQTPNTIGWRLPIIDVGREAEGRTFVARLFRNAPGLFYVSRVHEQVFSSVEVRREEWNMESGVAEVGLLHHGYTAEVVRDRDKVARNLRLLEMAIQEIPDDPNLLMNHGLELIRSGHFAAGLKRYGEAFAALDARPAEEITPELRETLLTQYSSHLMKAGRWSEIVNILDSRVARAGRLSASLQFTLGLARQELKHWPAAATAFRACIAARHEPAFYLVNTAIQGGAPRHCLALALWQSGALEEAAREFATGLGEDPNLAPLRMDAARFAAQHGDPIEALKLFHGLVTENTRFVDAWIRGARVALSQPDFIEFARDWTAEAIKHHPANHELIAARGETLLLTQQYADALPFWVQLNGHPRALSARLLCELMQGEFSIDGPPDNERETSQEFLNWYRRLLSYRAVDGVQAVGERLEILANILPSAARTLNHVLQEAGVEAA